MNDDRLTIFIPVRHFHQQHLASAVASVFAQTRDDWKLLIVEDSPEHGDVRGVLADRLSDPRVRIVRRTGRMLGAAYNTAMREAETEFIAALLGDDMLVANAVETLGLYLRRNPEGDFFHSGRYFVDGNGKRISADYPPGRVSSREDFLSVSPVKHLMCWRRSKALACGGVDETLRNFAADDWDFPWTMFDHGAVFVPVPLALYVFRDHRDGYRLTTHVNRDVQVAELRRILGKHGAAPDDIEALVRDAKRGYLKQSLFRNAVHRWIKERVGYDPTAGWRERYRQ